MPESIFGLPTHPLVVHATVVIVPLAAIALLLSALVPRFRRWAGILTPVLAVAALVLDPLSTDSGENLESQVGGSSLIQQHAEYADGLIFWVIGLTVLALGYWWFERRAKRSNGATQPSRMVSLAMAVLAVVVVLGTSVQIVLIGHSGAKAAWSGVATSSSGQGSSGDSD